MREVNVYTFDELSEEVQKKVIERYSKMWSTEMSDELEMSMDGKFYDLVDGMDNTFELAYSLCYCQGDGVSFTGNVEGKYNLLKLVDLVYSIDTPSIPIRYIKRLINWGIIHEVQFTRNSNHYCHKYTVDITVVDSYNIDCMDGNYERILEAMQDFENDINTWFMHVCDELEDFGYSEIEYLQSEECIRETILNSDLEFTEDGRDF